MCSPMETVHSSGEKTRLYSTSLLPRFPFKISFLPFKPYVSDYVTLLLLNTKEQIVGESTKRAHDMTVLVKDVLKTECVMCHKPIHQKPYSPPGH